MVSDEAIQQLQHFQALRGFRPFLGATALVDQRQSKLQRTCSSKLVPLPNPCVCLFLTPVCLLQIPTPRTPYVACLLTAYFTPLFTETREIDAQDDEVSPLILD